MRAMDVGVVLEHDRAPAMREQVRGGRGLLEHGAVGTQVAGEDDRAALLRERHARAGG